MWMRMVIATIGALVLDIVGIQFPIKKVPIAEAAQVMFVYNAMIFHVDISKLFGFVYVILYFC